MNVVLGGPCLLQRLVRLWHAPSSTPVNADRNPVLSVVHGNFGELGSAARHNLEMADAGRRRRHDRLACARRGSEPHFDFLRRRDESSRNSRVKMLPCVAMTRNLPSRWWKRGEAPPFERGVQAKSPVTGGMGREEGVRQPRNTDGPEDEAHRKEAICPRLHRLSLRESRECTWREAIVLVRKNTLRLRCCLAERPALTVLLAAART